MKQFQQRSKVVESLHNGDYERIIGSSSVESVLDVYEESLSREIWEATYFSSLSLSLSLKMNLIFF